MRILLLGIYFLCYIIYTHQRKPIGKLTNLASVTRFEGLEKYYETLLRQKPETPPQESRQPEKNANIKKVLCKSIFTSDFFDMNQEDWLDLDLKDNRMELKNEHPQLFKSIYREYRILCLSLSFTGDSCYSYKYENNYKLLPVRVGALRREEYTFVCLVRDRQSRKIKPYFVSEEFDVNMINTYPMAGRFILTYDSNRNDTSSEELVVHAMAEEPAVGWDFLGRFIEMYYVSERNANRPRSANSRRSLPSELTNDRISPLDNEDQWRTTAMNKPTDDLVIKRPRLGTIPEMNKPTDDPVRRPRLGTDNGRNQNVTINKPLIVGGAKRVSAFNRTRIDIGKNSTDVYKSLSQFPWPGAVRSIGSRRTNNATTRAITPENKDPICQLSVGEKLRLCATIFASSVFKGKVKFLPTVDNVQLDCEKKQISFSAEVADPPPFMARITQWEIRESGKKVYEESMIGCRGLIKGKNYKMTYLVSQGNYDNSVFVYTHRFSDRRVFVYNYFNNTSVI